MTYQPLDEDNDGVVDADIDTQSTDTAELVVGSDGPATSFSEIGAGSGGADGVRYASSFTGANGGAQIQAAIDDLPADGGTVIVGPEGPDAGSDVTDAAGVYVDSGDKFEIPSGENVWLLTSDIRLDDDVTVLLQGAFLALQDAADSNFFVNRTAGDGTTDRNANIAVVGQGNVRLHGNAANQTRTSADPDQTGLHPHKVDNFYLSGLKLIATNGWGVVPEDVNQRSPHDIGYVNDVQFVQDSRGDNPDGLHVNGPARNIYCTGITGVTSDDFFVVSTVGGRTYGSGGPASHIILNGFRGSTDDVGDMFKIPGGDFTVENIGVFNGTYRVPDTPQVMFSLVSANEASGNVTTDNCRNISIGNVVAENVQGVDGLGGVDGFANVSLSNVRIDPLAGQLINVNETGQTQENITLSNVQVNLSQQPPGIINAASGTLRNLSINGLVVTSDVNRSSAAINLDATVERMQVNGMVVEGNESGTMATGVNVGAGASLSKVDLGDIQMNPAGVSTLYSVGNAAVRRNGIIGGGQIDGVDLGTVSGEFVGDFGVSDGTTNTAGKLYRWDGAAWVAV